MGVNLIVLLNQFLKVLDPNVGDFWIFTSTLYWAGWIILKYTEEKNEKKSKSKDSNSSDSPLHS